MRRAWLLAIGATWLVLAGCDQLTGKKATKDDETEEDDEPKKKKKKKKDDGATSSATASASAAPTASASASASASEGDKGPMVTIPGGTLRAGASCGAVPRVTDEELVHPSIAMNEFSIDVYPFPNDPSRAPKTGVTRDEAAGLCREAGKRLCTELEWERACKGSDNLTFEYTGNYDKDACAAPPGLMPGKRQKCTSSFGVADLHGLAFEWTASAWGRGTGASLATVRGYQGSSNVVRERCASGAGRDPNKPGAEVGFRCCSGSENAAVVDLSLIKREVLTADDRVDPDLARDLMKAMPQDHQTVDGAALSFDKIWRWHPRDNEELVLGRWTGRIGRNNPFFELVVFKVCGGVPARVARIRGPVEKLERLRQLDNARERLVFDVSTDKDRGEVKLAYWYGSVAVTQPDWIKEGNSIKAKGPRLNPDKLRPKK